MSMSKKYKSILSGMAVLAVSATGLGGAGLAYADELTTGAGGNNECPVGVLPGAPGDSSTTLDLEFGAGSQDLTRCLSRRHNVKIVIQVNKFCRDAVPNADCTRAYALGNISNMIKDYKYTHGMTQGQDYEIVAVVHSGGGGLLLKDSGFDGNGDPVGPGRNQFQGLVESLIADGVKFYFCQNTTRGFIRANILPEVGETTGGATAELIDGVQYTTAGVTAIAEFQQLGYEYVQP